MAEEQWLEENREIARNAAMPVQVEPTHPRTVMGYGLTKRELFAAMAMQNMIHPMGFDGPGIDPAKIARWAVEQADALIEGLKKS